MVGLAAIVFAAACASTSSSQPKAITAPTAAPPPAVNPFMGARFYVDPEFARMVARATAPTPEDTARLKKVAAFPTAVWLESVETAKLAGPTLDDALKQEAAGGGPIVPVFVVYNLPNRDCAAEGSRGELFVDKGGEARYQTEFIDVIAAAFAAHPSQKIAVVLEPDSLAEPGDQPRGADLRRRRADLPPRHRLRDQQAVDAQRLHLPGRRARRVAGLAQEPAQGGGACSRRCWRSAGGADRIRGFAVNVSNYDPPREPKAQEERPRRSRARTRSATRTISPPAWPRSGSPARASSSTPAATASARSGRRRATGATSRGRAWASARPIAPAPNIDAYFWVKTPGESDGTTDRKAARFDENCVSDDAMPGAPEAGELFAPYLIELAKNANPPL